MKVAFVPSLFILAFVTASVEPWEPTTQDEGVFNGCRQYISSVIDLGKRAAASRKLCADINAFSTLVGCYSDASKNSSSNFEYPLHFCKETYNVSLTPQNFTDAYKYLLKKGITLKEWKAKNLTKLTTPVILNREKSILYVKAMQNFYKVYTNSSYFGFGAVGYWLLVCLIGGAANWFMVLFPNVRLFLNGKVSKFWRRKVTLPALIQKKQAVAQKWGFLWFLIPSRIESIVSILFLAYLIGASAADIQYIEGDPVLKSKGRVLLRYVADRTGIVCTILVPILLLFGGRNNILMWLTRWKYSTFVAYHRWVGRWVVVLAFVHTVCYSEYFVLGKNYSSQMRRTYVIWGLVAVISGCLILFQGLLILRRKWYETFLVIHILLAVFFVVGTWYHVIDLGFGQIMYAAFAVWAFDRFVRISRLLYFGFPVAEVTLLEERLEVIVPRPARWKPVVGGYAWLHFGHKFYFWQSHPFSYTFDEKTVTFYCTIHSGITKTIAKQLASTPGRTASIRVGVEGPYGVSNPIKRHSDVVFVAGGNGIPGPLSEFRELVEVQNSKQRLRFHWIIKEIHLFEEMSRHFAKLSPSNSEISVYVTRPIVMELLSSSASEEVKFETKSDETDKLSFLKNEYPHISFFTGRPDVDGLVQSSITESSNSVAFVSCGPPAMVDDIRCSVIENMDMTQKRVDFYDMLELWT